MADRGSPTQNHRDHVHIDTFRDGGLIPRMHGGGLVDGPYQQGLGLRSDERAAILQLGERVVPRQPEYVRGTSGRTDSSYATTTTSRLEADVTVRAATDDEVSRQTARKVNRGLVRELRRMGLQ
jgi:hypothetical protein